MYDEQLLVDLHVHSIGSMHAYSTVDTILEKCPLPYVGITDHLQNFEDLCLAFNTSYYIMGMRSAYLEEDRLLIGVELDSYSDIKKLKFKADCVDYTILSHHCNGPLDVDYMKHLIDTLHPTILGHPYRYAETYQDIIKWDEIVAYAIEKGVIIELNETSLNQINVTKLSEYHPVLSFGSDAHVAHKVGKLDKCIQFQRQYFPNCKVVNYSQDWIDSLKNKRPKKALSLPSWATD